MKIEIELKNGDLAELEYEEIKYMSMEDRLEHINLVRQAIKTSNDNLIYLVGSKGDYIKYYKFGEENFEELDSIGVNISEIRTIKIKSDLELWTKDDDKKFNEREIDNTFDPVWTKLEEKSEEKL